MKQTRAAALNENMDRIMDRDRILFNNPVLIQGMGLAPIVAAATNLQNACVLGLAILILLPAVRILGAKLTRRIPYKMRAAAFTLISAVVYIPIWFLARYLFGTGLQAAGIYLPLLVVEPMIIKRYENPKPEHTKMALRKSIITMAGFELTLFLVAFLRELLGSGTLFGHPVLKLTAGPLPFLQLICGGFILTGLLAALLRGIRRLFKQVVGMEAKRK